MGEIGTDNRDEPGRGPQGDDASAKAHPRIDPDATVGIDSALESGRINLKEIVLQLSSRLARAESQLARLGRAANLLNHRVDNAASLLDELAGRLYGNSNAINTICSILKDLDDPYGFGASLDERLAYESPEWTQEE